MVPNCPAASVVSLASGYDAVGWLVILICIAGIALIVIVGGFFALVLGGIACDGFLGPDGDKALTAGMRIAGILAFLVFLGIHSVIFATGCFLFFGLLLWMFRGVVRFFAEDSDGKKPASTPSTAVSAEPSLPRHPGEPTNEPSLTR